MGSFLRWTQDLKEEEEENLDWSQVGTFALAGRTFEKMLHFSTKTKTSLGHMCCLFHMNDILKLELMNLYIWFLKLSSWWIDQSLKSNQAQSVSLVRFAAWASCKCFLRTELIFFHRPTSSLYFNPLWVGFSHIPVPKTRTDQCLLIFCSLLMEPRTEERLNSLEAIWSSV